MSTASLDAPVNPEPRAAIRVERLSKRYKDVLAVDDVSFTVAPGEIFGFMGHNGAGKTTTIKMLLGLVRPTSGMASVLGHDVVRESLDVRRVSGFLPGSYALPKEMTAASFLTYIASMFGMSREASRARVDELLSLFGLTGVAHKKLGGFSSGMTQKVGLAQALLNEPRVLFLDEPTSGLDPIGRHEFLQHVRHLARDKGVTVMFSTHILSDIESICESVAVLHRGRLVAVGPLDALRRRYGESRMDDLYLKLARAHEAQSGVRS
ncbi:ABC transporter ATP-binding protein [Sorangium sp. So ce1036]|uniref:ABC transporter ATP-binding protein n=1 Tax=Sorangium sp. So ce1036 TaxID=3133328 RepID=UPI003EFF4D9D